MHLFVQRQFIYWAFQQYLILHKIAMRSYLFILLFVFLSVTVSARHHHRREPKQV